MTLRHMTIFLEVASCNNMSIAAQNLYISQSTVSLAVSEIEKTYNIRLFDRLSKHLRLTEAGMLLLDYASRIITLYKEMESALLGLHLKQIHIGSTLVAASCLLQDIIRAYHITCPDVSTRFTIDDSYFMEKKLAAGELDVMLTETKGSHSSLVYTSFLDDTFMAICSPKHPYAKRKNLSIVDFENELFLLREEGNSTRAALERALSKQGITLTKSHIYHNIDALKEAVAQNEGISIISKMLIREELSGGRLHACPVTDLPMKRVFYIAQRKDRTTLPYVREFIRLCRETPGRQPESVPVQEQKKGSQEYS